MKHNAGGLSGFDTLVGVSTRAHIGRYELHDEIGRGGMGRVHLGRLVGPAGFARTVAIKRLHDALVADPEFLAMFLDEARLAARLRHPNIVSTIDVVSSDGEVAIIMEYIDGVSLAHVVDVHRERGERVDGARAAAIMLGVLHGLQAAHDATDEGGQPLGVVHRDVSPQNILLGADGIARVLDFGVAKAAGRMHSTRPTEVKGKLRYMAPEQLEGEPVDARTDVFAASLVLWELLVGRQLYDAESEGAAIDQVLRAEATPPGELVRELGDTFDAVLKKGLAADPDERFPSAREMARALESIVTPTSQLELAEWVERTVGPELADRRRLVREIESERRDPRPAETSEAPTRIDRPRAEKAGQVSTPRASSVRRRPRWPLIVVAAVAIAAAVAVLAVPRWRAASESAPADASAELSLDRTEYLPGDRIEVRFARRVTVAADSTAWLAIVAGGGSADADSITTRPVYDRADSATLSAPRSPGAYEVRLVTSSPRGGARLLGSAAFTIVDSPTARADQRFRLGRSQLHPGEKLDVRFDVPLVAKASERFWMTIVPVGSPDATYGVWAFLPPSARRWVELSARRAGEYEVRLHANFPAQTANVVDRATIRVTPWPAGSCECWFEGDVHLCPSENIAKRCGDVTGPQGGACVFDCTRWTANTFDHVGTGGFCAGAVTSSHTGSERAGDILDGRVACSTK